MAARGDVPDPFWKISKESVLSAINLALPIILSVASGLLFVVFWGGFGLFMVAIVGSVAAWVLNRGLHGSQQTVVEKLGWQRHAIMSTLATQTDQLKITISTSPHVRVTVFGHDTVNDQFIPIMRRCGNPDLQRIHREFIPHGEGVIGQVWQSGGGNFECRAKRNSDKYLRQQHLATGISGTVYDNLAMKPFSMIGVALRYENESYGVVIVESDSQDVNVAQQGDTLLAATEIVSITRIVMGMRSMLGDLRDDREYNTKVPCD